MGGDSDRVSRRRRDRRGLCSTLLNFTDVYWSMTYFRYFCAVYCLSYVPVIQQGKRCHVPLSHSGHCTAGKCNGLGYMEDLEVAWEDLDGASDIWGNLALPRDI